MNRVLACFYLMVSLFISAEIKAETSDFKGIYGDDNRRLVSELNPADDSKVINTSKAVLAQLPLWRISSESETDYYIEAKSLSGSMNLCSDEKFGQLPLISNCSAFLVGPDLLLTAGHCLKEVNDCQKNIWILDYDDQSGFDEGLSTVKLSKSKTVKCNQIVSWVVNSKLDYALLRINKKFNDRPFLKLRREKKVTNSDSLYVVGHPMGLPKIVADQARIRDNSLINTFVTSADTFSGNSGSPVVNTVTHLVEGILIKGDADFVMDFDMGCNRAYHCLNNECTGETVLRSGVLPLNLIPKI